MTSWLVLHNSTSEDAQRFEAVGYFSNIAATAPSIMAPIVAGTLSPAAPPIVRLTSAAYCLLFVLAGKHFDHYWGLVVWPTWVFAFGWGLEMVRQNLRIVARATEPRQPITNP